MRNDRARSLVVVAAVMGGYLMEGGNPAVLIQPAEFIIIQIQQIAGQTGGSDQPPR